LFHGPLTIVKSFSTLSGLWERRAENFQF